MKIITLLTDFGTADGYVAAMKGVLLASCPDARIVDATHAIPPRDVRAGAWALRHYWNVFPNDTVHVAVVDPGVGTSREPLLVQADGRWLVGPDNGLFSWVFKNARHWTAHRIRPGVRRPGSIGETFHGRDVFAYAAGQLAAGVPWRKLAGTPLRPFRFQWPTPKAVKNGIRGSIVHIDRFGNAITNIPIDRIAKRGKLLSIVCNNFSVNKLCISYGAVKVGRPVAFGESFWLLELAVNQGNASKSFQLSLGDSVVVRW